jgi:DNA-binding transcriptional LysR family regulator
LGVSLFDRLGKRIVITEAGQKLMRYAQKKLKVIPWLDEPLETGVLMIRYKDKWISPALEAFMDISRETMKLPI